LIVRGASFCSTVVNEESGIGIDVRVVDAALLPPPALPVVAVPPDVLDEPDVLVVFVPLIVVAAVVDAVCRTVLPVPLASDVLFVVPDSIVFEDVVVSPELLDVIALTPEVDVAVNCDVPLPAAPPDEEVEEEFVPCR